MAKKKLKVNLVPAIRKLEVATKELVTTGIVGSYKSVFKGQGLEFESYRKYNPGEDASRIDWKATVRTGKPMVKEFIEERNLHTFFIVDVSDNMVFGSTDKLKSEFAAELTASLAHAILEAGDQIGFVLFSDHDINKVKPKSGTNQFYALSKQLVDSDNYGGVFSLSNALDFLFSFVKEKALVIIVSDFIGTKDHWEEQIKVASKKYDLIAMIVRDPRDLTLPNEEMQVSIKDPATGKTKVINPALIKHDYEKIVRQKDKELVKIFEENDVDYIQLVTDKPFVNSIIKFFKRRQERWR